MLLRECFANFVRMNHMFYPHSFACTTLKIPSQYFALSNGIRKNKLLQVSLALCDFFYTTPKIHLKYFALSNFIAKHISCVNLSCKFNKNPTSTLKISTKIQQNFGTFYTLSKNFAKNFKFFSFHLLSVGGGGIVLLAYPNFLRFAGLDL